jgi:hypothetical protein
MFGVSFMTSNKSWMEYGCDVEVEGNDKRPEALRIM